MYRRPRSSIEDINNPADRLSPLESGLNVSIGEMAATLIAGESGVGVYGPKPISLRAERSPFGTGNARYFDIDAIRISGMSDWSNSSYNEIPLVTAMPVDRSEVFAREFLTTFPTETPD